MPLDYGYLKGKQEEFEKGSGSKRYFEQKMLKEKEPQAIRVMPDLSGVLNGAYFLKVVSYWINNKPYISLKTFDEPCVIDEEIENARNYNDKGINKLLDDTDLLKEQNSYVLPILLLDVKMGARGVVANCDVIDDCVKVFTCTVQMIKAINAIAFDRNYMNDTEDGFTDRVEGFNIDIEKTVANKKTEYGARPHRLPYEMPQKYYNDIPNIVEYIRARVYPDDYLRSVICNYLYAEPLLEKPELKKFQFKGTTAEEEEPKSRRPGVAAPAEKEVEEKTQSRPAASSRPAPKSSRPNPAKQSRPEKEEIDTDEVVKSNPRERAFVDTEEKLDKPKGKNLLDRLSEEED